MPKLFWGDGLRKQIKGLDVLGVRRVDQVAESRLSGGITTVSQRARYLSDLTWLVTEWMVRETRDGAAEHDHYSFRQAQGRLEALVLAATAVAGADGNQRGLIGAQLYGEQMKALKGGGSFVLPEGGSATLLNTYYGPVRAMDLLMDAAGDDQAPWRTTERGKRLWEERSETMNGNPLAGMVFTGGTLDQAMLLEHGHAFSANGLPHSPGEAAVLRSAFFGDASEAATAPFRKSLDWLMAASAEEPIRPVELFGNAMRSTERGANDADRPVAARWGEVEFRRRVHYPLELLLSAFCTDLQAHADETGESASAAEIARRWASEEEVCPAVLDLWPGADAAWHRPAAGALADVDMDALWEAPLASHWFSSVKPHERALAALMILATCAKLGAQAFPPDQGTGGKALAIVDGALAGAQPNASIMDLVVRLLSEVILPAHYATALRKLGGGLDSSLRFFPEGGNGRFRPTPTATGAGFSGDRLTNIMVMLADIGCLVQADGGFAAAAQAEGAAK